MEKNKCSSLKESLSGKSRQLYDALSALRKECDKFTLENYSRINPLPENLISWQERGKQVANEGCVAYDSTTIIGKPEIGKDCWIGLNCLIDGSGFLSIGNHCVISSGVHIYTHDTIKWAISGGKEAYRHEKTLIGNNTFIGAQSVITAGVTIGKQCLICANSTVTSDIGDLCIAAGTPAKIIGHVEVVDGKVSLIYDKTKN